MTDFLAQTRFLDNSLSAWLYAAVAAVVAALLISWILRVGAGRLAKRVQDKRPLHLLGTMRVLLSLLRSTRLWLLLLLALALAFDTLQLPRSTNTILGHIAFLVFGIQIALWCISLVRLWLEESADSSAALKAKNPILVGMLSWGLKLVVWAILLLAILGNFGVNITAFVASLGVGGIAIALGLQTILKDVFASIAIGLDQPYKVGEFIMFGDVLGTVVKVGVKSTRIASLSGEELSISNSNLLDQLVHNYSRMPQRRIVFGFRVPFSTPRKTVETIVQKTAGFLKEEEQVRFDRGHLKAFGDYGYEFEFVYYVLSSDYTLYMDIQQRVNLKITRMLEDEGATLAVPTNRLLPPETSGAKPAALDPKPGTDNAGDAAVTAALLGPR
ncbi:MAG TPA: mechanosensitive ion channel family protein [Nevskiaceae bacterium]